MKYLEIAKSCGAVPHREYDSVTGSYYEYGDIVITEQQLHAYTEQVCKQSMQGESIPAGFALVPIKETKAIRLVVEQEDWEWRDVLAAAGSITEDEFNSPDYVETIADLQAENESLRKDADRLDYIEEHWYVSGVVQHDDGWYVPEKSLTFKTFRQAIDAAISKGGE